MCCGRFGQRLTSFFPYINCIDFFLDNISAGKSVLGDYGPETCLEQASRGTGVSDVSKAADLCEIRSKRPIGLRIERTFFSGKFISLSM